MTDLTETDYGILTLALIKCRLFQEFTKDGEFKLCVVSKENIPLAAQKGYLTMVIPFGFPDMSDKEVINDLMQKLDVHQKIAWLKDQQGEP
jgi:hypothetical protein